MYPELNFIGTSKEEVEKNQKEYVNRFYKKIGKKVNHKKGKR